MEHAIQSILPAGEDVEILVVNDGSKDRTREIGELYASKYPSIVKVINKENGGHGDAVNYGLMHATGKYFKVVDSDDKVDGESLEKIMDVLKKFERDGREVDMVLSNYVYDKVGKKHKKVMNYRTVIRPNRILDWDKANQLRLGQYILMHSVIYRTEMLKGCKMELPKHTFYVDNIYVYHPLPHVKKFCYVDTDFYLYYIGREDQSVNEKVMIGRLDQQIFVTKTMIDMYHLEEDVQSRKLRHYMRNYLSMMMTISTILCIRSKNAENLEKMRGLWQYLKEQDKVTYRKIRHGLLGVLCHLPGRTGRAIGAGIYCIVRKVVGFS
jgi:glycosyltransferase involved in cell wall biosynthesis